MSGKIRIRAAVMSMVVVIVSINSHLGSRSQLWSSELVKGSLCASKFYHDVICGDVPQLAYIFMYKWIREPRL